MVGNLCDLIVYNVRRVHHPVQYKPSGVYVDLGSDSDSKGSLSKLIPLYTLVFPDWTDTGVGRLDGPPCVTSTRKETVCGKRRGLNMCRRLTSIPVMCTYRKESPAIDPWMEGTNDETAPGVDTENKNRLSLGRVEIFIFPLSLTVQTSGATVGPHRRR